MNDKFFIDTNIFIYSFDKTDPNKQQRAKEIIGDALRSNGCISYQVIQEFLNVATQKFATRLKKQDCQKFLSTVLEPLCEIYSTIGLFNDTLEIQEGWQYSFYDSLIIAAALKANCRILYSEDLPHGQRIKELIIINPFQKNI